MNVVLCGMMGVGKSSVARALSALTGRELVDTDGVIISRHGSISAIFERQGEGYFRALETEVCRELSQRENLVISTGGGLVLRDENVAELKKKGKIFLLRATLETLCARVVADETRPLLKDEATRTQTLTKLLETRTPVYERAADVIVDTDGKTVEEVAREILAAMEVV